MATADSSATTPSKTPLETLQQYETAFKQRKTALQQTIEEIEDIQNNRAVPAIICAKEDAAVVKCLSHNSMSANPFCCQADLDAYVKCVEEYPIKRK
jgi:hypothetical protein